MATEAKHPMPVKMASVITFKPFRALVTSIVIVFLFCAILLMQAINNSERNASNRLVQEITSTRIENQLELSVDKRLEHMQRVQDAIAGDVKVVPVLKNDHALLPGDEDEEQPAEEYRKTVSPRQASHKDALAKNRDILLNLQPKMLKPENRPPDSAYNINITLSDTISLDRKVIDSRPPQCQKIQYDINSLPTASVIIPFHNEALSMLLRTVHSILNNTPDVLLADVIMVDDHSVYSHLQEHLVEYVKYLPKVKLIRTAERIGLIKARLVGVEHARGDVMVFQDAHTECNVGWLEPLLAEIQRNPRAVVQPHIDRIDPESIEYKNDMEFYPIGAFGWDLRFAWLAVPSHEHHRIKSDPAKAIRSPTLVGCALAADKANFLATGSFDAGLKIWGGENLELSFRTWMCGGEVLSVPCSRIAHVFKVQTYGFQGEKAKIVKRNSMRVAEVWLDDYKRFFYAATAETEAPLEDAGKASIEERKQLREKLQCQRFDWYLDNVFPDLQIPSDDATVYGDVTNTHSDVCLKPDPKTNYVTLTGECYTFRIQPSYEFYLDTKSRFRYRDLCIDFGDNLLLKIMNCDYADVNSQRSWSLRTFEYAKRTGKIVASTANGGVVNEYCLAHVTNIIEPYKGEQMPQMNKCNAESKFQTWRFMYHIDQNTLALHKPSVEL